MVMDTLNDSNVIKIVTFVYKITIIHCFIDTHLILYFKVKHKSNLDINVRHECSYTNDTFVFFRVTHSKFANGILLQNLR